MYIEITSRSFDIEFKEGDSLNQMRLIYNKHQYINDSDLIKIHENDFITNNNKNSKIHPNINNGLNISVDLSNDEKINAYVAKDLTPLLQFNKIKSHKIEDFWEPIKVKKNTIIIKKNKFYILKSKEKIQIPNNMAGEMIPYDTRSRRL